MTKTEGVIVVNGNVPGPILTIMTGVHGDEVCGPRALDQLLPLLTAESIRGRLYLIRANLRGIQEGKRQVEMNLNRAFRPEELLTVQEQKSYERQRALELMPFLDESQALLDIHSSTSRESTPFIICEPHSFDLASQMPVPIVSWGWDKLEPGGTDYYMNRQAKCGLCVECGYHLDPLAEERARSSILVFLSLYGATIGSPATTPEIGPQKFVHAYHIHHTRVDFIPVREYADFEILQAGQVIGYDGGEPLVASADDCIIFARPRNEPDKEAFILGRIERRIV